MTLEKKRPDATVCGYVSGGRDSDRKFPAMNEIVI